MTTGPQSNLSPTSTLGSPGDGSANAPSGTPELSTLLSGYSATPQWKVAGVNYYVGISSGTVLLNPATISMSGVTVNSSTHTITVTGNNVTLNGYDFSLNGGWQVTQAAGATNLTITNSNFVIGSNNNNEVVQAIGSGTLTLLNNNFNGSGTAGSGANQDTLVMAAGGGLTAEYNYFSNAYSDFIDVGFGTGNYNILYNAFNGYGYGASVHADVVQTWGNSIASLNVEYNTVYQPAPTGGWPIAANSFVRIGDEDLVLDGGGSYNGSLNNAVNNPVIAYNTVVAAGQNTLDNLVQLSVDKSSTSEIVNPSIYDNYFDPTGLVYGVYYPIYGNGSYIVNPNIASNIDMLNGSILLSGQYNGLNQGVQSGAPGAPTISSDTLTGASQNQAVLAGTAAATSTIDIYDGSTFLGTTAANSSGAWSFTTGTLSSGAHSLTATATDAFGNTGAASNVVDPIVGSAVTTTGTETGSTSSGSSASGGTSSSGTTTGTGSASSGSTSSSGSASGGASSSGTTTGTGTGGASSGSTSSDGTASGGAASSGTTTGTGTGGASSGSTSSGSSASGGTSSSGTTTGTGAGTSSGSTPTGSSATGTASPGTGAASGSGGVTDPSGGTGSGGITSSAGTGAGTGAGSGSSGAVTAPAAPVLNIADHTLSVSPGKTVDLGLGVGIPNAGDNVTVNITGLPHYETITDNLDHKTFSGSNITLTAAEVNSGVTLHSNYQGRGQPSATLTVTATDHAGTPTTGAAQSILVKDPPSSPVSGTSGSKSNGSGSTRLSGLASSSQGGWSARSTNGHQVDVSQWFDQHPGFAKAVNTLSDAVSSRPGTTSTVGSSADQTASAGGRAFALLSQMMAGDFGNGSHFAQNASSTAQPQRQTPNLLTRPLH